MDVNAVIAGKKAVLFDLFHTLTSLEAAGAEGPSTAEFLGIDRNEWDRQLFECSADRLTGKNRDPFTIVRGMVHAIRPDIPDELIMEATRRRMIRFEKSLKDVPSSTLDALREVRSMGKKTALVSNADVLEIFGWEKSPLSDLFDAVIFSCEAGVAKPDLGIYELALSSLKVAPEDAAFVGDGGSNELAGARRAGITAIMTTEFIRDLRPDKINQRVPDADYVIDGLDELVRSGS
jgi:putative hydrolase of the HAD superfamily